MAQKFRLVKEGAPNPGEYMTAPGYFIAAKKPEKLTQANMAAVDDKDYTNDRAKAYIAKLPESSATNYKAEFDALHALSLTYKCRLEPAE